MNGSAGQRGTHCPYALIRDDLLQAGHNLEESMYLQLRYVHSRAVRGVCVTDVAQRFEASGARERIGECSLYMLVISKRIPI